jgi:two-component system cell cycle response regulator DivK
MARFTEVEMDDITDARVCVLPAAKRSGTAQSAGRGRSRPERARDYAGRRALVVEGDARTRQICRDVLDGFGFVVDVVDGGVAAVMAARRAAPDLILMDLQLRDAPGMEAIRWLRANPALESVPVVAISTNRADSARLADGTASAILRKPVSPAAILRALRAALK